MPSPLPSFQRPVDNTDRQLTGAVYNFQRTHVIEVRRRFDTADRPLAAAQIPLLYWGDPTQALFARVPDVGTQMLPLTYDPYRPDAQRHPGVSAP